MAGRARGRARGQPALASTGIVRPGLPESSGHPVSTETAEQLLPGATAPILQQQSAPAAASSVAAPGLGVNGAKQPVQFRGRGKPVAGRTASSVVPVEGQSTDRDLDGDTLGLGALDLEDDVLVTRPAVGTLGRKLGLFVNFFPIDISAASQILFHRVHIDFASALQKSNNVPARKEPGKRDKFTIEENRLIFWSLIEQRSDVFQKKHGLAYDGGHIVFSTHSLNFAGLSEQVCPKSGLPLIAFDVDVSLPNLGRSKKFRVLWWKYTTSYSHGASKLRTKFGDIEPMQIFDIIFRQQHTASLDVDNSKFVAVRSSFYMNPRFGTLSGGPPTDLGLGRDVWNGYYSSAHVLAGNKFWLNIDTVNTAFFKQQALLDLICTLCEQKFSARYCARSNLRVFNRNAGDQEYFKHPEVARFLNNELKGVKLVTTHGNTKRAYRFGKLSPSNSSARSQTMTVTASSSGSSRTITIQQYFTEKYGIDLQLVDLPLVVVGGGRKDEEPIFLPIEQCVVKDGQRSTKKLSEEQTSKMIKAVCWDADTRKNNIQKLASVAQEQGGFCGEFGLRVSSEFARVDGRVLPQPRIAYGNQGVVAQVKEGAWLHPDQFVQGSRFVWACLGVGVDTRRNDDLERFLRQLAQSAYKFGCRCSEFPDHFGFVDLNSGKIKEELRRCKEALLAKGRGEKMFVLCVLQSKDSYADIKGCAEVELGLMTQCVMAKNVYPGGPGGPAAKRIPSTQTLENLLLKINMKLGGHNWRVVADPRISMHDKIFPESSAGLDLSRSEKRFLVLGVDVTHPGPGDCSPSVAAVVGSVDEYHVRFVCKLAIQKGRREHMINLSGMVKDILSAYFRTNSIYPTHIVVYRDGVSDGQFQAVLDEELRSIKDACSALDASFRPNITYVVVQKRHHVRLFAASIQDKVGKSRNVPAGTTVDTVVTHPTGFDFYLCSHTGIQGTSRPTHYNVIFDDSSFSSDELQLLTYQLCHVYERCARSVSVPAPAYYADLICQRGRVYLEKHFGSDDSSSVSSSRGGAVSEETLQQAVTVNVDLASQMFFI